MEPWHEAFPQAFAEERAALEGIGFALDERELNDHGRVVFRGSIEHRDKRIELLVVYPQSFPEFRPEIYAENLDLDRHQNPFRRNLCLLDRSTRAWDQDWLVAHYIQERVPYLLNLLEEGAERLREEEAPQGEPLSAFFDTPRGVAVLIPGPMLTVPPAEVAGDLRIAVSSREPSTVALHGCLSRVTGPRRKGRDGPVLAGLSGPLAERFDKTAIRGTWVRLAAFPTEGSGTAEELTTAARATRGFVQPPWVSVEGGQIRILGVVASEEVRQNVYEDGWLFAVDARTDKGFQSYVVRGQRVDIEDLAARIPGAEALQSHVVSLVGLGTIGAPLALELARSLIGRLRLLDCDVVEAGTIVRWPRGVPAIGHPKTEILRQWIPSELPYTAVDAFDHPLGVAQRPDEPPRRSESEVVSEFLSETDLLIDATGELGVQQLLSRLGDEAGIPQIFVSMTEGGWGGMVSLVTPGRGGCWLCLQHHLMYEAVRLPPRADDGTVQPRGCGARTFTGSSFAALPVVAQAARVATHVLRFGAQGDAGEVFVCSQAEQPDRITTTSWERFDLPVHPSCEYCAAK